MDLTYRYSLVLSPAVRVLPVVCLYKEQNLPPRISPRNRQFSVIATRETCLGEHENHGAYRTHGILAEKKLLEFTRIEKSVFFHKQINHNFNLN